MTLHENQELKIVYREEKNQHRSSFLLVRISSSDIVIRIFSSAFYHLHFIFRILSSIFYHPPEGFFKLIAFFDHS